MSDPSNFVMKPVATVFRGSNYSDSKCVWGYMTLCDNCVKTGVAPYYVDTSEPIKEVFPLAKRCENCKAKLLPAKVAS